MLATPVVLSPSPPAQAFAEADPQVRQTRASLLVQRVFDLLRTIPGMHDVPESEANRVRLYSMGMVEGALAADPAMRDAFAAQFDSLLCDGRPTEAQTIVLAHMAMAIPDSLDMRGFDCFFSRAKEDVRLWSMLETWRQTGLPESPALAKLHGEATDPRTARRFLSPDEAMRQRAPAPYQHFASDSAQGR